MKTPKLFKKKEKSIKSISKNNSPQDTKNYFFPGQVRISEEQMWSTEYIERIQKNGGYIYIKAYILESPNKEVSKIYEIKDVVFLNKLENSEYTKDLLDFGRAYVCEIYFHLGNEAGWIGSIGFKKGNKFVVLSSRVPNVLTRRMTMAILKSIKR